MDEYIERESTLYRMKVDIRPPFAVVADMPAADVAPVVRCKDCCHSYDSIGGLVCSYGPCVDCIVPEDFYCKHGERKNENDK